MGIFDRIGRLARSEVSELKRVLREGRDTPSAGPSDPFEADERERQRLIVEAEQELAQGDTDELAAEIEAGAAAWATPGAEDEELARGADLWADTAQARSSGGAADATQREAGAGRAARGATFSREVRLAYAALELPLGSDRAAVEAAYRAMAMRYHPDRHVRAPHLQEAATELTIRVREARDLLVAWLAGA